MIEIEQEIEFRKLMGWQWYECTYVGSPVPVFGEPAKVSYNFLPPTAMKLNGRSDWKRLPSQRQDYELKSWEIISRWIKDFQKIHEMEMFLNDEEYMKYSDILCSLVAPEDNPILWRRNYLSAPPEKRVEALLKTKGKWKTEELLPTKN